MSDKVEKMAARLGAGGLICGRGGVKLKIAAKEARNWGGLRIETAGASTAERIHGGCRMNGRKSWVGNAALADVTEIWDGTSEIQRFVISRALTGR